VGEGAQDEGVAEEGGDIGLGRGDGAFDELDETDAQAGAEGAAGQAQGGGGFAFAGAGVDLKKAEGQWWRHNWIAFNRNVCRHCRIGKMGLSTRAGGNSVNRWVLKKVKGWRAWKEKILFSEGVYTGEE